MGAKVAFVKVTRLAIRLLQPQHPLLHPLLRLLAHLLLHPLLPPPQLPLLPPLPHPHLRLLPRLHLHQHLRRLPPKALQRLPPRLRQNHQRRPPRRNRAKMQCKEVTRQMSTAGVQVAQLVHPPKNASTTLIALAVFARATKHATHPLRLRHPRNPQQKVRQRNLPRHLLRHPPRHPLSHPPTRSNAPSRLLLPQPRTPLNLRPPRPSANCGLKTRTSMV